MRSRSSHKQIALGFGLAVASGCYPGAARAEMKYFQIARLLNFKTECQMTGFEDKSPRTGPGRFLVSCGNVTFYPEGLWLECPDRDDEWTCRIVTQAQTFKGLDILRQK